jgi:hypothetical protein
MPEFSSAPDLSHLCSRVRVLGSLRDRTLSQDGTKLAATSCLLPCLVHLQFS